jgi:hypothetical protein
MVYPCAAVSAHRHDAVRERSGRFRVIWNVAGSIPLVLLLSVWRDAELDQKIRDGAEEWHAIEESTLDELCQSLDAVWCRLRERLDPDQAVACAQSARAE